MAPLLPQGSTPCQRGLTRSQSERVEQRATPRLPIRATTEPILSLWVTPLSGVAAVVEATVVLVVLVVVGTAPQAEGQVLLGRPDRDMTVVAATSVSETGAVVTVRLATRSLLGLAAMAILVSVSARRATTGT